MRLRPAPSISKPTRTAAAVAALLMLGASACGQADAPQAASSTGETMADYTSPIAEFLGVDFDSSDQQDQYLAAERDRIEWVTTCMAEEGFEYRSVDPAVWAANTGSATDPDAPEWGTPEWVALYGFGVSTQMFDQATVGPNLVGSSSVTDFSDIEDPNNDYVSMLSDVEQSAYWEALHGNHGYEWDESMSDEENQDAADIYFENLVETGCEPRSYEMMAQDDPYSRLYDAFGDELNEMYERVQSDSEVINALADVSRCASEAGFGFTDEESVYQDIYERLEPVQNAMVWPTDGMDEAAWSALSDEARTELERAQPTMTDEGKAMLAEIQQFEIEMATAVYDCGYGDLQTLYPQVLRRYEQQFIDAHRTDLESLRTT